MQGRRSLDNPVEPVNFNIQLIGRKRREPEIIEEFSSASESSENTANMSEDKEFNSNMQRRLNKDIHRPVIGPSPLCIVLDDASRNFEIKTVHFNILPSFHGMPSEEPLGFIREFYSAVQSIPTQNLSEDQLRMKCFFIQSKIKQNSGC